MLSFSMIITPDINDYKGVVFDFDGTLIPSVKAYKSFEQFKNFVNAWRGMLPYKQDADKVLLALKERGINLSLATDMDDYMFEWFLKSKAMETAPLDQIFGSNIVTGSMVKNKKPRPDAIYMALRKMKLKPEQCIAFGDSLKDIEAARDVPRLSVCVLHDHNSDKDRYALDTLVPYQIKNWGEVLRDL